MRDETIGAEWVGNGAGAGYALGPAGSGVRVAIVVDRFGSARWRLYKHSRPVASGHWEACGLPSEIVYDGAERALAAAWRRGLS